MFEKGVSPSKEVYITWQSVIFALAVIIIMTTMVLLLEKIKKRFDMKSLTMKLKKKFLRLPEYS